MPAYPCPEGPPAYIPRPRNSGCGLLAALSVGTQLGKKRLQNAIDNAVAQAVDKEIEAKLVPRLTAIENRILGD